MTLNLCYDGLLYFLMCQRSFRTHKCSPGASFQFTFTLKNWLQPSEGSISGSTMLKMLLQNQTLVYYNSDSKHFSLIHVGRKHRFLPSELLCLQTQKGTNRHSPVMAYKVRVLAFLVLQSSRFRCKDCSLFETICPKG